MTDDDGSVDAGLAAALTAYGDEVARLPEVLAALHGARVLAPIVAVLHEPGTSPAGVPVGKTSDIALGPSHKIIQGDWPWHANRGNTDTRSIWHNYKGQSRFNMLYGDGHVQSYRFPIEMQNWTYTPAPDRAWLWW